MTDNSTMNWNAKELKEAANSLKRTPKSSKKKNRINPIIYYSIVVVVSIFLGCVAWFIADDLCAFDKEYKEAEITIIKSDDVASVTQKLKDEGIIKYPLVFKMFCKLIDAESRIGVGTYTVNTNMDYKALVNKLRNRQATLKADTVTVTIPEGYTVEKICEVLADYGVNTVDNLKEAAKNGTYEYTFLDESLKGTFQYLEGYMFPDTYEFYVNEDANHALNRFVSLFQEKMTADLLAKIESTGYTLKEIITMASLIEKETTGSDQALISSVINNRLKNTSAETAGYLQLDSSSAYSSDEGYNLYKKKGLPVTPICNPGIDSINAAISPTSSSYYYYALGTDGKHHFFKTYTEHLNFINSSSYQPIT